MICSISAGKSSSNWLDRLWSKKGIAIGDDLHLRNFINNPNSNQSSPPITIASNSPNSISSSDANDNALHNRNPSAADVSSHAGEQEWAGLNVVSNVLSELFNIGQPAIQNSRKKCSRKQMNPKICITQSPDNTLRTVERDRSDVAAKCQCFETLYAVETKNDRREAKDDKVEQEKSKVAERELVGYSRSEVTVIDTSCDVWKSDKLVFRRRNVWKVRDKKGNSRTFGRKKRKPNGFDGNLVCQKKQKTLSLEIQSLKEDHGKEDHSAVRADVLKNLNCVPFLDQYFQDDKCEEDSEGSKGKGYRSEGPRNKFPRQARKRGSTVIIIKPVPPSKTDEGKLYGN